MTDLNENSYDPDNIYLFLSSLLECWRNKDIGSIAKENIQINEEHIKRLANQLYDKLLEIKDTYTENEPDEHKFASLVLVSLLQEPNHLNFFNDPPADKSVYLVGSAKFLYIVGLNINWEKLEEYNSGITKTVDTIIDKISESKCEIPDYFVLIFSLLGYTLENLNQQIDAET